nr:hypothetical protein BaRGS_014062 [Batillaria attramentaria]
MATAGFRSNVDKLVRCLQQISEDGYNVKEVVKGGSLGKGTATPDSDIDLVVYFNGLRSIQDLEDARPDLKRLIKSAIKHSTFSHQIEWKKGTTFAVKCRMNGTGVDILPAFDVLGELGTPAAVYKSMKRYPGGPDEAADQYSASLTKLQRNFVRKTDSTVKGATRMLKEWSKENDVDISSYCLELVAIYVDSRNPDLSQEDLFRKCMGRLANCHALCIAFDEYYDSDRYTRYMDAPYILDPANPYKDTLEHADWKEVSRDANAYFREDNYY